MKVAVIGGGWAGLAAAVELTNLEHSVTLFEAGRQPGGRARSVTLDGRELDNGQHLMLGAYRDTLALMRQIGVDPQTVLERHPLRIADNTGFCLSLPRWPTPFNLAWGLATASGPGLREKLRTATWMQGLKQQRFQLDTTLGTQSVAAWLDGAGQTGVLRRHLWEPLCLAALNTPAECASAQHFANVLRDSLGSPNQEDTDLLLPRVPLGKVLPEPACRWLAEKGASLRLGYRVRELSTDARGISIAGERFDGTVLATAPSHLAALFPTLACNYVYEPIATVYLQLAAHVRLNFPLENRLGRPMAGGTAGRSKQAYSSCHSNPHPGQQDQALTYWVVDRGKGLLACVLSGRGDWESLDDAMLASTLSADLSKGKPVWWRVIREKRATFSCQPGLHRLQESTTNPRLVLAGDHTWADYPATLEGAVRSGLRAARTLQAALHSA